MPPSLTIASATLAALALLLTALSLQVSRLRMHHRQTWGDGGHKDLAVAVRTHANTLEQSLLFGLLLLALVQAGGTGPTTLAAVCSVFVLARLIYCTAAFGRRLPWRQAAHALTLLCQLAATLLLVRAAWTS
ncbi:putative MAPEG superfamily protein related to glutathione S-transferase [Acidovorax sp. CF316]|uniref:MAPEG family protein n=1 Tax=Acidovorax sp. CF316 TaxID=1144317 RepID=UPI00026BD7CD|nr:MAPEG family protein [Acidovorax sp. CF316]EJE51659.1 putative MAPEG superfamily protein related to glutathione S-transferase [Acidovorax sp. CF316]